MNRSITFLLASACMLVSMVASAQTGPGIEDRLQISEALAQYAYRWDGKDAAGFAALFAEDGEMERWVAGERVPDSLMQGRDAIQAYAARSHQGRLADRQTRHHFSAVVFLELDDVRAVTENMALITHQTAGGPPFIASSGIYRITWRKTESGWKMAQRILFTDRFDP